MLPSERLVALLRDFHAQFPTVPVRLLVQTLGGVGRAIRSGAATIGVGNGLHMDLTGLRQIDIAGVQVIPVAAPDHPLASAREAARAGTRDFVQIVLSEQPFGENRDFAVVSLNTWRVGDLTAKHQLILGGIGWGGMPEPMVRADIESGRLVRLNLRDWRGGEYLLKALHKIDTPPGPAGRWLIERLAASGPEAEAQDVHEIPKPAHAKKHRRPAKKTVYSRTK
jgi:DNA-binding transcriptional LysR family regulator